MDLYSIQQNEFRPICLGDKPLFDEYLRKYPQQSSELTFTNIFCWAEVKRHRFCENNGYLFVSYVKNDGLHLFPPIGPTPEIINNPNLVHLPEYYWESIDENLMKKIGNVFSLRFDQDNSDYIYRVSTITSLSGTRFDGKRNYIRRFQKLKPEVRHLTSNMASECLLIQEAWLKGQQDNPTAIREDIAIKQALRYFDELKLEGIAIFVDGKLVGFAIGERLNETTYVEHFEKAIFGYKGIYQFLHHEFAKFVENKCIFLNCEQDLGIPGLRIAKEGWYPEPIGKKYTLRMANDQYHRVPIMIQQKVAFSVPRGLSQPFLGKQA